MHAATQAGTNSYLYDANGNMTNRLGSPITYDYDNRAASLTGSGGTVQSVYDYTGQRVKKIAPSGTTVYIGKLFECTNGVCTKYIFSSSTLVASVNGANTYFYQDDHLGSSSVVTDQSGNEVEEIHYYPFGQVLSKTGSANVKYEFTGQEADPETGLYYYNARYYDPALSRFISADIFVQSPYDPQSLNRYSYVDNNPILYIDPTGRFTWKHPFRHPFSGIGHVFNTRTLIEIAITAVAFYAAGEIIAAGNVLDGCEVVQTITPLEQAGIHAVAGTFAGGLAGAINGDNGGRGALIGGISGGFGDYARNFIPDGFGYQLGGQAIVGGVTGGFTSEMSGNGFGKGFLSGAGIGAAGYLFNEELHRLLMDEGQEHSELAARQQFYESNPGNPDYISFLGLRVRVWVIYISLSMQVRTFRRRYSSSLSPYALL
ncbi:MAG: RHS repeat-associated core domain-containing protein [Desulfobacteraceae bacterium]|nr:RHS repeat-associated core domain-containing protein [Desulfobacteraceae bacterium]